ncbi:MAG: cyclic nucleotide-binding domain-containing protein [Chloroflexi bacterium]|nr:cyclic nucleotide-binding domain-containing protein [Chloroflexota bacterium]
MVSLEKILSYLADVSSLKRLTPEQFYELAEMCQVETFDAGEHVFCQGDVDGALFIVVEGRVILEREINNKTDSISLNSVNPGEYFGEISLFLDAPRSVTATAMEPSKVIKLINDDFKKFASKYPALLVELNRILSLHLVEAHDKISEVTQTKKPREMHKLYDKLDF